MLRKPRFKIYRREKDFNLCLKNNFINTKFSKKIIKKKFDKKGKYYIPTHYSNQLKEKRKLKIVYGISDKKYNIYYNMSKKEGDKYDIINNIIKILECRLDNILYRSFFCFSRFEAKQLISHKFVKVNNKLSNVASKILKKGDYVSFKDSFNFFRKDYFIKYFDLIPSWIFANIKKCSFYLKREPNLFDIKFQYLNFNNSYIFKK